MLSGGGGEGKLIEALQKTHFSQVFSDKLDISIPSNSIWGKCVPFPEKLNNLFPCEVDLLVQLDACLPSKSLRRGLVLKEFLHVCVCVPGDMFKNVHSHVIAK